MNTLAAELGEAAASWEGRGWPRPDVVVVAGSALAVDLGSPIAEPTDLAELVPFEIFAVEGHALRLEIYRPLPDRVVAYLRGRLHCYQGFSAHQVVFPLRLAGLLGARTAILTNAAGSLDPTLPPGRLVAISDHINLSGRNPLTGNLPPAWGPRFPALDEAYDPRLRRLAAATAESLGMRLGEGVYTWLLGPSYETPAEIAMLRRAGATLVGMSTVPEVLAARQMGIRCLAISLVTNLASGLGGEPPSHEEVVAEGERAAGGFASLLGTLLAHDELTPEVAA
ncbi:MAG: purine-nucleoside phosphorylase [Thermoanaerobaculia bacterium]|nr:purine-nucleoside phosphorylase [Thermoanaerobaculia bacterium]